jgi:Zn-dependent protease with chaperone function
MIQTIAVFVGCAWAAWCVFVAIVTLAGPYLVPHTTAMTNGLWVVFPEAVRARLTQEQQAAVIAHERGHIARGHIFINMVRAFIFLRLPLHMAILQELQADDYAAARGHGPALASALRAIGTEAFDFYRASRLSPR